MKLAISLLILTLTVSFSAASFADPYILLDKSTYSYGDTITVSGNVEYQQETFVIIQIRSQSDIVAISQMFPSNSGTFSATFNAEGPKWQEPGVYTVMMSYAGQKTENTFQFKSQEKPAEIQTEEKPEPPEKPKIVIKGFPDPTKSPQHYYDRYDNEPEFKSWFDSVFAGYTIQEIIGFKPTHVRDFPDSNYSPQYYIDRYNNEDLFREWFEQQFPGKTIYDVVGVTEQPSMVAPGWVKQYARMWSGEEIDDRRFIDGITDLIGQGIIVIDGNMVKQDSQDKAIPSWFKRSASWYGQGLITDDDFLAGLQYLIEKEIIVV